MNVLRNLQSRPIVSVLNSFLKAVSDWDYLILRGNICHSFRFKYFTVSMPQEVILASGIPRVSLFLSRLLLEPQVGKFHYQIDIFMATWLCYFMVGGLCRHLSKSQLFFHAILGELDCTLSISLAIGPQSCASTVNATIGG